MILIINEDWRLASDPLQWSLQKRKPVKGKTLWRPVAYFRTLDATIIALVRRHTCSIGGTYGPEALQPLMSSLDQLRDDIHTALASFQTEAAAYHGRAGQ